jgi:thiosulfate dehydrogenase [quinone] large subunit
MKDMIKYSKGQTIVLAALRIAIGWIMLYQGIVKFYTPGWTSKGYLLSSDGIFSGLFEAMGNSGGLVSVLDFLNIYGQLAIGLGLILGLFVNIASIAGILMLAMYYLSHPPFPGLSGQVSDNVVNDLVILIIGLFVCLFFPSSHLIGLDRLWKRKAIHKTSTQQA